MAFYLAGGSGQRRAGGQRCCVGLRRLRGGGGCEILATRGRLGAARGGRRQRPLDRLVAVDALVLARLPIKGLVVRLRLLLRVLLAEAAREPTSQKRARALRRRTWQLVTHCICASDSEPEKKPLGMGPGASLASWNCLSQACVG